LCIQCGPEVQRCHYDIEVTMLLKFLLEVFSVDLHQSTSDAKKMGRTLQIIFRNCTLRNRKNKNLPNQIFTVKWLRKMPNLSYLAFKNASWQPCLTHFYQPKRQSFLPLRLWGKGSTQDTAAASLTEWQFSIRFILSVCTPRSRELWGRPVMVMLQWSSEKAFTLQLRREKMTGSVDACWMLYNAFHLRTHHNSKVWENDCKCRCVLHVFRDLSTKYSIWNTSHHLVFI